MWPEGGKQASNRRVEEHTTPLARLDAAPGLDGAAALGRDGGMAVGARGAVERVERGGTAPRADAIVAREHGLGDARGCGRALGAGGGERLVRGAAIAGD